MATDQFPISVVIPVRNSPAQLKQCLEALLANPLDAAEILIVDDASTDETRAVAAAFPQSGVVSLRCIGLPRRSGPAVARNQGALQARHPHVLFLDADILLPPQSLAWIRETLAAHRERPEVIGVMGVYSETIPWKDFVSNFKNIYICFLHATTPTVSPYLHTPILCMRKDILEAAGGFDSSLETAEDFRLGLKLGSQGYRFIVDRRIQGTHLKRLTLRGLLREDARRLRDLLRIQRDKEQQRDTFQAHRWSRLSSVLLPFPMLLLTAVSPLSIAAAWTAAALWLLFYSCNLGFVRFAVVAKGVRFGLMAAAFLYVEMLWAQGVLAYWLVRRK